MFVFQLVSFDLLLPYLREMRGQTGLNKQFKPTPKEADLIELHCLQFRHILDTPLTNQVDLFIFRIIMVRTYVVPIFRGNSVLSDLSLSLQSPSRQYTNSLKDKFHFAFQTLNVTVTMIVNISAIR